MVAVVADGDQQRRLLVLLLHVAEFCLDLGPYMLWLASWTQLLIVSMEWWCKTSALFCSFFFLSFSVSVLLSFGCRHLQMPGTDCTQGNCAVGERGSGYYCEFCTLLIYSLMRVFWLLLSVFVFLVHLLASHACPVCTHIAWKTTYNFFGGTVRCLLITKIRFFC